MTKLQSNYFKKKRKKKSMDQLKIVQNIISDAAFLTRSSTGNVLQL